MTEVVIVLEERFHKDASGAYYSHVFDEGFWRRYFSVFEKVAVFARATDKSTGDGVRKLGNRVGTSVRFIEAPYYQGHKEGIRSLVPLIQQVRRTCSHGKVFLLRMPGLLPSLFLPCLVFRRISFGVELLGDPYEVFGSGRIGGRLRPFFREFFYRATKIACTRAAAVSYVSERSMSARYPAKAGAFVMDVSDIELPHEQIVTDRTVRCYESDKRFMLLGVGSLEQRYKGFDILIRSVALIRKSFPNVNVRIVGEGIYRKELEKLAVAEGLENNVSFVGAIPRADVFREMDEADLLIVPSKTEGLPRVILEAFARGLPCLGSDVGGIPTLLDSKYLFRSGDETALAALLRETIGHVEIRKQMSLENLSKASMYTSDRLQARRAHFYRYLHDLHCGLPG